MIDRDKMLATTDDDIRRHAIEDGEPVDVELPDGVVIVPPTQLRLRLGMSQAIFAQAIGVPLKTVQNWEQERTPPDPAARTLLTLVAADPRHVLGLLGWAEREDVPEASIERPSPKKKGAGSKWVRRRTEGPSRTPVGQRA